MQKTANGGVYPLAPSRKPAAAPAWVRKLRSLHQTKTIRVMKLTFVFLTVLLVHAYAGSDAQSITLSGKKLPLHEVFGIVKQQTGYTAFYNRQLLSDANPVSLDVQNMPLFDFLSLLMKDQPLNFNIQDKTIFLSRKPDLRPEVAASTAQQQFYVIPVPIRIRVTDSLGNPLPGATVLNKNTKHSGVTAANGSINLNADAGDVITVSFVGFEPTTVVVKKDNTAMLHVIMRPTRSKLDEVQIVAYGSTSLRYNVGAISTVTAETIERQPVTNVLLALQGQVPGLTITPTTGAPGSAIKLQIRGQNTLASSAAAAQSPGARPFDQPLFIIDGVPTAAQNNSLGHLFTVGHSALSTSRPPANGISPFSNINPADIESITVLRDADATSIYGSQGANGVILITTKKGKASKPSLSIRLNSGITAGVRRLEMLSTEQYLDMRRDALVADNITLTPNMVNTYPDLLLFDPERNVDWYKEFFDKNPVTTDLHVSFSGGQQNSSFILSGGYTNTPYNFAGDFKEERFSLHSGYSYRSANNKLTVQFTNDFSYSRNNAGAQPRVMGTMSMPPNYPALIDEDDKLVWNYKGLSTAFYNQYAYLRQPANIQLHTWNNAVRLAYQVLPGLNVSSNFGYSRTNTVSYNAVPLSAQEPSPSSKATASFVNNTVQAINVEPQLDYKRTIGSGELSILAGGTYRKQNSINASMDGSGFANDDLLKAIAGATTITVYNSSNIYKYVGGYTRIGYIHDRKYILNVTGRRDGSTNFGPGRRWGSFGSIGAGWIFTEENFWPKSLSILSFGKLSGNYGTNGSDGIAPYNYQAYYQIASANTTLPFQGVRAYTPYNLFNPIYSWSTKRSWNVSMDLGFLKDRLLLNFTWYKNSTSDQLMAYNLPAQVGFSSVLGNFPATVQNNGLELSITSTNIQSKHLRWTSSFNISGNRNKLASFPGLETSPYSQAYVIGKSVGIINGYQFAGLDANTGLFTFYNSKGEVTSRPNSQHISKGGDMQPLFDLNPTFGGGLGNTISYKNLSVMFFFQFSKQRARNWIGGLYAYAMPGSYMNLPVEALNYWRKPGDQTPLQKLTASGYGAAYSPGQAFVNSTGAYSDASYLRLKTVSVSYSLPERIVNKVGVRGCSIYANAQNLLTITGYEVADPEMAGAIYTLPLQRNVVLGLNLNF
ncbi:MAG: SusC/RagA family TonB-linked outer membrane protein [Candidatus Pseudobacter hemicellulosilyticus]|uniref:SusC/RagA family TonB-linked outer membrane protein n=1 Tax=Candidatus Pseudobacter hemicellulosilyticus TaxID=3121375 RepID=A0AAJ6BGD8_9BACT|nr:MAG: SusC/RagA family TonB-linked outer membrane protein [Pseudobacter sp.]